SKEDVHLTTVSIVHFILEKVSTEKENYPILYQIMDDLYNVTNITESAKRTKQLLDDGHALTQIASIRKLKLVTIYEQLVEIALHDKQFSINKYVSGSAQEEIIRTINHLQSYKLKDIKLAANEEMTYFQIRLVLAKFNQLRGEK